MIYFFLVAACMAANSFVGASNNFSRAVSQASTSIQTKRELIDKVVARVNGQTITLSQLETPQIANNGKVFERDQYIAYTLWLQRAQERQIEAPADDVARNIAQYKQDNGLVGVPADEADRLLKGKIGIDFATYKKQLEQYFMIESLKSFEFRNRCSVAEAEVRAYYDTHPVVVPAEYKIDLAVISSLQESQWKSGSLALDTLEWTALDWLAEDKLADHLKGVKNLSLHSCMSVPHGSGQSFLIKLMGKKDTYTQTFPERYHLIEMALQREKVAKHAHETEAEILRDAVIATF